jgi:hypothetical protein
MVRTSVVAAVLLIASAATVLNARPGQRDAGGRQERLDPRIAAADPKKYTSIVDAEEWRNPYLVMGPDGIAVIAKGIPSGERTVAPTDLLRTLVDLPVDAWPYGRVVAASDIGIRSVDRTTGLPDRREEETIKRNHQAAINILKALRVTVEWRPSA